VDDFSWNVRVRSTGRGQATAYVREHQFTVGEPIHFDAEYERVTGLEYVLGALGADLVAGLQRAALRRRIAIDHVEAVVSGTLDNPLTYLGVVGEQGHPGIERIVARVYVGADEDEAQLEEAWQEALGRSPFVGVLARAIDLQLTFKAIP
jgi:hypothetical protein